MPKMYITIPPDIKFVDPKTREPIEGGEPYSLKDLVDKAMSNPKWVTTYDLMKSARAIEDALAEALASDADPKVMVLADSDYKNLLDAVKNPKSTVLTPAGNQVQQGFGFHPSLASQFIPLLDAIVDAKDKPAEGPKLVKDEAEKVG